MGPSVYVSARISRVSRSLLCSAASLDRRINRVRLCSSLACGWIGLPLNLVFIFVSFSREAEVCSALETAMEAIWIGGMTFFGLGALVLKDHWDRIDVRG